MFKNVLLLTKYFSVKMVQIIELNFLVEQIFHDLQQCYCKNPKRHSKFKFIGYFSVYGNYLAPIVLCISAMYIFRLILKRVLHHILAFFYQIKLNSTAPTISMFICAILSTSDIGNIDANFEW